MRGGGTAAAATAFLLAVICLCGAHAYIDLGPENMVQRQVAGFSSQSDDRSVSATQGTYNYTVQNQNGSIDLVEFDIPQVRQEFVLSANAWWLPAFAFPTISQACLIQNAAAYNASQLLSPGGVLPQQPQSFRSANTTRTIGSFWGTVASIGQSIGCAYANSVTYGNADALGIGCSTPYLTVSAFTDYAQKQSALWATQVAFNQNVQSWQANATQEFKTLVNATIQIQQYQIAESQAVGNLTQVVSNQQTQIDNIVSQTTAGINTLQGEIVQTNAVAQQTYNALAAFSTATATAFENATIANNAQFARIASQVNFLTNSSVINQQSNSANFQQLQLNLIQLSIAIQAMLTQSQYLPQLRETFTEQQQVVEDLNIGGDHDYQFFVNNIGTQGVANLNKLPVELARYTMEAALLRYIYTNPGPIAVAAYTQIQLNCGGRYLAINQYPLSSWTQIINALGKPGTNQNCTTDENVQGPTYCNCWIQVVESGCAMATDQNVTSPTYTQPLPGPLANWTAWNDPGFPPPDAGVDFCAFPPIPFTIPSLPGGIIRNATDWDNFQIALCQRGVNPASIITGSQGQTLGYDVFSAFFKQRYAATYTTAACQPNMLGLMNPSGVDKIGVTFTSMNFFVSAFSLSTAAVQKIGNQVLGVVPLNTTIITEEFQDLGAGPTGTCKTMYVTAYDMKNWVNIRQYTRNQVFKTVTVRLNGQPFSQSNSFVLSNPNSKYMDDLDGAYIAAFAGEQWITSVYDIAYDDTIPRPNPFQRLGSPLYYGIEAEFQPVWPTTYNLTIWRDTNIFPFDHAAGSTSMNIFRNGLICDNSFTPPKCVCDAAQRGPASNGQICEMLRFYSVITGLGNRYEFVSEDDILTGVISVPAGQYVSIAGSACPAPSFSTAINTNYGIRTVDLYNNLATTNVVEMHVSGTCGSVENITLAPLSHTPYELKYCPDDPGDPIYLTFYNFAANIRTLCNTTLNATIVPSNPVINSGNMGQTFENAEVLRSVSSNAALINTQQVITQMVGAVLELTMASATIMQQNYLTFASTGNPLGPFQNVFDIIGQLGQNVSQNLLNSQQYQFSYTGDVTNYTAINLGLLNLTIEANARAQNYTYQLGLTIQQAQVTLQNLIAINAQTALLVNQSQVGLALLNAVTAQIIAESGSDDPNIALGSLFNALTTIGGWTAGEVDKGLDAVEKIGGDFASAAGGVFGALGSVVAWIIIIIVVGGIIAVSIFLCVKCCPSGQCKRADGSSVATEITRAEYEQMRQDIALLKQRYGLSSSSNAAAAASPSFTAGARRAPPPPSAKNKNKNAGGGDETHRYSALETIDSQP